MAFQPADFLTHHGFRRRAARVWGLECATTVAARPPPQVPAVHSLHLPASKLRPDWLGVASGFRPRGFADFDGIRPGRFRACRSIAQVRCVYQFRHRGLTRQCNRIGGRGLLLASRPESCAYVSVRDHISRKPAPVARRAACAARHLRCAWPAGECLQVTGANGAGKTTLLRALCGLVPLEEGRVCWRGADIALDLPALSRRAHLPRPRQWPEGRPDRG